MRDGHPVSVLALPLIKSSDASHVMITMYTPSLEHYVLGVNAQDKTTSMSKVL